MNLRVKTDNFEIEINNTDVTRFEKTLIAAFAAMEGQSFVEVYKNTEVDASSYNSRKKFYIEPVNGVREHSNGVKEYKCSYNCMCGNRGVRYVHEDAQTTTCHKCKAELKLSPATANDAHDHEYNYFVAYG